MAQLAPIMAQEGVDQRYWENKKILAIFCCISLYFINGTIFVDIYVVPRVGGLFD